MAMTPTASDEHYWGWGWMYGLPDREASSGGTGREYDDDLRLVQARDFAALAAG